MKQGAFLTAFDVQERLLQEVPPFHLLLWPPNVFAFTSSVLSLSGAYQLVVSPPPPPPSTSAEDRDLYHWPPKRRLLEKMFDRLKTTPLHHPRSRREVRFDVQKELDFAERMVDQINASELPNERLWTFMVRRCALEWRSSFDRMSSDEWRRYGEQIPSGLAEQDDRKSVDVGALEQFLPEFLLACWTLFERQYLNKNKKGAAQNLSSLLCNAVPNARIDRSDSTSQIMDAWIAAAALLTVHAITDDTCVGWGILQKETLEIKFPDPAYVRGLQAGVGDALVYRDAKVSNVSFAQLQAGRYLTTFGTLATISPSRGRVLPKRHNPDVGITLRSISSNIAFHHSAIEVVWTRDNESPLALALGTSETSGDLGRSRHDVRDANVRDSSRFSMLLLPFPMHVQTKDFRRFNGQEAQDAIDNRQGYGFFEYEQKRKADVHDMINVVDNVNRDEEMVVDAIILPEAAIDQSAHNALLKGLREKIPEKAVSLVIAGVSTDAPDARFRRDNTVQYSSWGPAGYTVGVQHKHHRWQLNQSQIQQYGLTQSLPVETKWWEAINVGRRRVSFVNIGDRVTVCPLICEDLARQDPIADLVRQVGPSIVVAILMDGPQHKDRWSSRYAAILAEDPGSAVLALTSFGMVRRWSTRFGRLSRVVALWNDKNGSREIELEQGASGILLSLTVQDEPEVIADGRLEICPTAKIELEDVIQIHAGPG